MASTGLDRATGTVLMDWEHVLQSIDTIFTTEIGERVMLRQFGSSAPVLLGRLVTATNVLRFFALLGVAIELWEPRFRVVKFVPRRMSVEEVRAGRLSFSIEGEYRPRAHLGDFTPEGTRQITFAQSASGFGVS